MGALTLSRHPVYRRQRERGRGVTQALASVRLLETLIASLKG